MEMYNLQFSIEYDCEEPPTREIAAPFSVLSCNRQLGYSGHLISKTVIVKVLHLISKLFLQ